MKTAINKLQQLPRLIFTITLFSILAACGGGGSTATPPVVQNDASLKSIVLSTSTPTGTLSPVTLSPALANNVTNYTASTKAKTITVTPTVNNAKATLTVNSAKIDSGASKDIPLSVDNSNNIITITVTAEDGIAEQIYRITVTLIPLSTNANLSGLALSVGNFNPPFDSDVTEYTLTTTAETTTVETTTVTPTVRDTENATVTVNGTKVDTGTASTSIDFNSNQNIITIIVTAEDGETKKTYTVTRINPSPDDASLLSLVLSDEKFIPPFASNIYEYKLNTNAKSTTVTATANQGEAMVKINSITEKKYTASASFDLIKGDNTITVEVTASDGETKKTYKIIVTSIDVFPTDASLSSIVLSAGSLNPAFDSTVTDYKLTATTDTTTVIPFASQPAAEVTVNETKTNSGSKSEPIPLSPGEDKTTIDIVVTAPDGIKTRTYTITVTRFATLELINPKATDAKNHKFGQKIVQLGNGNIIVHALGYGTNSVAWPNTNIGAVHLYKPTSGTAIASFYGTNQGDNLGSGGIIALANNNFVIVSPYEDKGTLDAVGSVKLVNGTTGKIMKTITGDSKNDHFANKGVTLLNDNQFVITSSDYQKDDVKTGSILVIDDKGDTIRTWYGNTLSDENGIKYNITNLGDQGVTALDNGNFVIVSTKYKHNERSNAGIVQLMQSNGLLIKSFTWEATETNDYFGGDGIIPLKNNNFLIATQTHHASADLTNAGSIHLINGNNGKKINKLVGDKKEGFLGKISGGYEENLATTTITTLGNSNYVVTHHTADNGNIKNAGSIRLFSGEDGKQIGTTLHGSNTDDFTKLYSGTKITALNNNNYVVTAAYSGKDDLGSIRLMNGANDANGKPLAIKYGGEYDLLGSDDVIGLSNHKYVVASSLQGIGGSVMVFNDKGELETTLMGTKSSFPGNGGSFLGNGGLTALGNNKFVIASHQDDVGGVKDSGSIRLVDANNTVYEEYIKVFSGDNEEDSFGLNGVTLLNNHNFVFAAPLDDVDDIRNVGSIQAVNGTTGVANATDKIVGSKSDVMKSIQLIRPVAGDYYILSQPLADDNGTNSGKVTLVVPTF